VNVHYRYSIADAATMCGAPFSDTWVTARFLVTCAECLAALDERAERLRGNVPPGDAK
jgi:hypothetical protein